EAPRNDAPAGMHGPERLIALGERLHDHPKAEDVGELFEADRLALHLAPDRVGRLAPAVHARRDAAVGELAPELLCDFADRGAVARGHRLGPLVDHLPGLRVVLPAR